MGLPFRYPGSAAAAHPIIEMTDAELLAKAMVWAALNDQCDGQAFNITNGDFTCWENVWPRLADFFRLPLAPPQRFPLALFMSDKEPVWKAMVQKHQLLDYSFQQAAAWPFGEAVFNLGYDVLSDTNKSRKCGFHEFVDSEEMLLACAASFSGCGSFPDAAGSCEREIAPFAVAGSSEIECRALPGV